MNYSKPDDTLEGYTYTDNYWEYEIRKKDTKRALVDVLKDWERKIHLLYDMPNERIDKQVSPNVKILNYNTNSKKHLPSNIK